MTLRLDSRFDAYETELAALHAELGGDLFAQTPTHGADWMWLHWAPDGGVRSYGHRIPGDPNGDTEIPVDASAATINAIAARVSRQEPLEVGLRAARETFLYNQSVYLRGATEAA